jgi:hypothetical protein
MLLMCVQRSPHMVPLDLPVGVCGEMWVQYRALQYCLLCGILVCVYVGFMGRAFLPQWPYMWQRP